MPIEFAPPAPNLQGFNVAQPQTSNPLETLARIGQIRTQGLQQQVSSTQLEQERMKLDSNKSLLDAMVQSGGDMDKLFKIATQPGSKVLPGDLIGVREHYTKMQQDAATLDKTTRENTATDIDRYRGLINGVQSQDDLAAANARADQIGIGKSVPRFQQYSDPTHLQAFNNSLATQAQVLKEAESRATTEREQAQTKLAGVQQTEAQQKVDAGTRQQLVADIRSSQMDPATGTPTPAAWQTILAKYQKSGLTLPAQPTKDDITRLVESAVPQEKMGEYRLNQYKADQGILGSGDMDLYLAQYAKAKGKALNQLTFPEYRAGVQQYAEDHQDPTIRALLIGQKGQQEKLTEAQIATLPTKERIHTFAQQLVDHDMSPSQLNELRSGRVSWAPDVFEEAKHIDPKFSPARAEAEYRTMTRTEEAFATGKEAQMVRANNNLMEHVGLLDDARKALGTGDIQALRRIQQEFGIQFGGDAGTTYDLIAKAVADEASKSFVPGSGGEGERAARQADFKRTLGDKQISSNIKGLLHIVDSQQRNLLHQYDAGTYGKGSLGDQLFTPRAIATRDRLLGGKPAGEAPLVIKVGDKRYQYKGSGAKSDLSNYTEIPPK